ncbi:hypothetical protein Tco_0933625 [Tanacetum coccineum]
MGNRSSHKVYSDKRIITVVKLNVKKKWGHDFLTSIVVKRSDNKEYEFSYADLPRLSLNDVEEMYLLKVQGKLHHLKLDFEMDFINAPLLYIRKVMIKNRVEDVQLGVQDKKEFDEDGELEQNGSRKQRGWRAVDSRLFFQDLNLVYNDERCSLTPTISHTDKLYNVNSIEHITGASSSATSSAPLTVKWLKADSIVKSWISLTLSETLQVLSNDDAITYATNDLNDKFAHVAGIIAHWDPFPDLATIRSMVTNEECCSTPKYKTRVIYVLSLLVSY